MTHYNYFDVICEDVRNYIKWENIEINEDNREEMANEYGYDLGELMQKGAEGVDVCIRCYLLGSCIEAIIEDIL